MGQANTKAKKVKPAEKWFVMQDYKEKERGEEQEVKHSSQSGSGS
jgi:hypothetical protein